MENKGSHLGNASQIELSSSQKIMMMENAALRKSVIFFFVCLFLFLVKHSHFKVNEFFEEKIIYFRDNNSFIS